MFAKTHFVAVSGNSKTGEIPVTYRSKATCEPTCPFHPDGPIGGCFGTGRIFGMAEKNTSSVPIDRARAVLARASKRARFMRDRVVGDIRTDSGIDHGYVRDVARVAGEFGLRVFGYTHAWRDHVTGETRITCADVQRVAGTGYVLNASCETVAGVRQAISLGMPAVIASDTVEDGELVTAPGPDGQEVTRRIVTCPAQSREDVTCASCGLCAKANRAAVVRFHIHGTARKRAARAVAAAL